jgi:hypothetical protein
MYEQPISLERFRKLFGMPACTEPDLMHCNHLKQTEIDGQFIAYCDKDEQCRQMTYEENVIALQEAVEEIE